MTEPALPEPMTIPVVDVATHRRCEIYTGTKPWRALLAWVEAHGLDPNNILARTGIQRDTGACRIRYTEFIRDDQGRRQLEPDPPDNEGWSHFQKREMVQQRDTPPLPFPGIIERLLEAAA